MATSRTKPQTDKNDGKKVVKKAVKKKPNKDAAAKKKAAKKPFYINPLTKILDEVASTKEGRESLLKYVEQMVKAHKVKVAHKITTKTKTVVVTKPASEIVKGLQIAGKTGRYKDVQDGRYAAPPRNYSAKRAIGKIKTDKLGYVPKPPK